MMLEEWHEPEAESPDMTNPRPITQQELDEIRESVREAVRRTTIAGTPQSRLEKRLRKKKGYGMDHFKAGELLEKLQFSPRPKLSDPEPKDILAKAAERDDTRFYIKLGKVLARKPVKRTAGISMTPPRSLDQFLIGCWMEPYENIPALYNLSEDGLADVCSHYLTSEVSVDMVVALRKRLGLKPFRRSKIHVILLEGNLKLL